MNDLEIDLYTYLYVCRSDLEGLPMRSLPETGPGNGLSRIRERNAQSNRNMSSTIECKMFDD